MKSLIIGNGQVGKGLYGAIKDFHETYVKDIEDLDIKDIEVLHLCFPYSDKFIEDANIYIDKYSPKLTINHASVAVGTSDALNGEVCYSPVRGKHPDLKKGIQTFDKFISGNSKKAVDMAVEYFKACNMNVIDLEGNKMKDLELCKLLSNIRYGYEICFFQESERIHKKFKADPGIFKMFEQSYNDGYKKMNEGYMVRPILHGGHIGGHCVMQCSGILQEQESSELLDWMFFSNMKKLVEDEQEIKRKM